MDAFEKKLKESEQEQVSEDAFDKAIKAQPYMGERAEAAAAAQSVGPVLQAGANVLDVLESPIRKGIDVTLGEASYEFIPRDPIAQTAQNLKAIWSGTKAAGQQLVENIEAPLTAPQSAPLYSEIARREIERAPVAPFVPERAKDVGAGIAGLGADFALPSATAKVATKVGSIPKVKSKLDDYLRKASTSLKSIERDQLTSVMARMINLSQFKNSNVRPDVIANVLVDNELGKYANDPAKMYEALSGIKQTQYKEVSPGLSQEIVEKTDGLIARKSKGMREEINEVAQSNNIQVEVPIFSSKQQLEQDVLLRDPLSGRVYTPEEVEKRKQIVEGLLKPYEEVIVPGVPLEQAQQLSRPGVPPPVPLDQPDLFPVGSQERLVQEPTYPPRPEFEGIDIPAPLRAPEDVNVMSAPQMKSGMDVVRRYPPKPQEPMGYGGVLSKEVREQYAKELSAWEKEVAKLDKQYDAQEAANLKDTDNTLKAAEQIRKSLENDAVKKYASAIKAWDEEVTKLKKDYLDELQSARKIDKAVEEAKVKQAADRFIEKAKRNKAYREEVMNVDSEYGETVMQALKSKVFTQARYWTLEDMMKLRTNIGKRLSSAEFHSDKPLTPEKEVLESVYHGLKKQISSMLAGKKVKVPGLDGNPMDAADYYEIQSTAVRRMMEAESVLEKAVLEDMKDPDIMSKLIGLGSASAVGAAGFVTGKMMGLEPTIPLSVAGIAGVAETYRQMKRGAPQAITRGTRVLRKGLEAGAENPETVIKGIGAGSRMIRDQYVMPQEGDEGYVPPQTYIPMQLKSIPEQLIETPLPRNSQDLLANKKLVLAKFAQQMPDKFGMLAEAAKDDQQFSEVLAYLANEPRVPGMKSARDMFVKDKYDMFDGKIMNPEMKMMAMNDVRNDENLNAIEKARLMNKIQKGQVI